MNIFDFENRLKGHAANTKGEVDMDRLLADLNLTPKSNSRSVYFFLSSALLLSLSAIAYFYFHSAPTENINQASIAKSELQKDQVNKKPDIKTTLSAAQNQITDNTTLKKDKLDIEENDSKVNKLLSRKSKSAKQKNTRIKQKGTRTHLQTRPIQPTDLSTPNFPKETVKTEVAVRENRLNLEPTLKQQAKTEITTEIGKEGEMGQLPQELGIINRTNESTNLLPTLSSLLTDYEDTNLDSKLKDCPRFGNRLWHLSIIPELGYTFPLKTLRLDEDDFKATFDERVANERTIEGFNASLYLQFKNQETGLYVKPGISYGRITERIDFEQSDIKIDTFFVEIITTNSEGEVIDTEINEVISQNEIITKSRVHYELHHFDLPVALGYSFDLGQFAIDIEGGIKFNFLQKTGGQILSSEEGEFINLNNRDQDLFKNSVGLGFFGGILLKRQITSRSEFYVSPRFTYNTLSFSSNDNPINQQYNVFGIHVGLIYAIY